MTFAGLPVQSVKYGGILQAHAESVTSVVDIRYDDFSDTGNLQLNGENLISCNAIQFRGIEGGGVSVFTKDKLSLDENNTFSTAFSFRFVSSAAPAAGTKGGFAFILKKDASSGDTGDFYENADDSSEETGKKIDDTSENAGDSSGNAGNYNDDAPSGFSIAFYARYVQSGVVTSLMALAVEPDETGMSETALATAPPVRCEVSATMYIDGEQYIELPLDGYIADESSSGIYNIWMGYDGEEKLLCLLLMTPSGEYKYERIPVELSETLASVECMQEIVDLK